MIILHLLYAALLLFILYVAGRDLLKGSAEESPLAFFVTGPDKIPVQRMESVVGPFRGADVCLPVSAAASETRDPLHRLRQAHFGILTYHNQNQNWSFYLERRYRGIVRKNGTPAHFSNTGTLELADGDQIQFGDASFTFRSCLAARTITRNRTGTGTGQLVQGQARAKQPGRLQRMLQTWFPTWGQGIPDANGISGSVARVYLAGLGLLLLLGAEVLWYRHDWRSWLGAGLLAVSHVILYRSYVRPFRYISLATVLATILTSVGVLLNISFTDGLTPGVAAIAGAILFAFYLRGGSRLRQIKLRYGLSIRTLAALAAPLVMLVLFLMTRTLWIMIGPFSFQASELIPVCFIWFSASNLRDAISIRGLLFYAGVALVNLAVLIVASELSTLIILVAIAGFTIISRLSARYGRLGRTAAILSLVTVWLLFNGVVYLAAAVAGQPAVSPVAAVHVQAAVSGPGGAQGAVTATGQRNSNSLVVQLGRKINARLQAWSAGYPMSNPDNSQMQKMRIYAASGSLTGVGPRYGQMKQANDDALRHDFVFGLIIEEFGLITAFLLVLLAFTFILLGMKNSFRTTYALAACAGAAAFSIGLRMWMNLASSTGMHLVLPGVPLVIGLPIMGLYFPFLSRAGSALIMIWLLIAMIEEAAMARQNLSRLAGGR